MAVIAGPGVHRDGGHVSHLKGLVRFAKKNIQSRGGGGAVIVFRIEKKVTNYVFRKSPLFL